MIEGTRFDLAYATMPWHRIEAVAFDIGNVLVRYVPEELCERLFPDDQAERQHMLESVYHGPLWQQIDRGTLTYEEAAERLAAEGDYPYADYLRAFRSGMALTQLLEEGWRAAERCRLAGKRLYLLSNYSREGYRALRERFAERFSIFDGDCISSHYLLLKPEPAFYQTLIDKFALDPAKTLFIDDMLENVDGAIRAGLNAFHMNAPGRLDRFFAETPGKG